MSSIKKDYSEPTSSKSVDLDDFPPLVGSILIAVMGIVFGSMLAWAL